MYLLYLFSRPSISIATQMPRDEKNIRENTSPAGAHFLFGNGVVGKLLLDAEIGMRDNPGDVSAESHVGRVKLLL
jgi:hypothetical protein